MKKAVLREYLKARGINLEIKVDCPNAKEIKIEALEFDKETGKVKPKKKTKKGDK